MSMLAEPRRKTQQCFINPRGDAWAKDENKFGQKLMEKFGWSKGKGLGREEQGMTDCIKVLTKDNKKGIGYKGSDDEWIKHYEGFESVLANLNSDNSKENSCSNSAANSDDEKKNASSLEKRSKGSRARVHYHKFTRGKDVSRYNSDDIACIIGSKRSKQLADIEATQIKEEDEVGQQVKLNGVTTVKGGTVQEYFAEKLAKLKMAQALQQEREDEDDIDKRRESEIGDENGRQGFGYCYEEQMPVNGKVSENEREERVGFAFEYPENGDDYSGDQAEKKKKKKKKKDKVKQKEVGEEESVSDTEASVSKTEKRKREIDEDLDAETQGKVDEIVKKKKKKKKNKERENDAEDVDAENLTIENCQEAEAEKLHVDMDNEKEKKTKNKKKKVDLDVVKAEELPTENSSKAEPDNMQSEDGVNSEKKKKKKKKKSKDKNTEELPIENSCEGESENVDVQRTDEVRENGEEVNGVDAGNEMEKPKKKKKRKLDETDGNNEESGVTEPQTSEKKKKKKKKSLCQEEIQEENCNEPSDEIPKAMPSDCTDEGEAKIAEETSQMEESTPKRKKGKKKKQKGSEDKDENSPSEEGDLSTATEGNKEGEESEETNNSEGKSDGKKR